MAEYLGRAEGGSNSVTREYAVASGVTVTDGDFVYLDANGRVSNASITTAARLLGTVVGGDTQNLDRVTNLAATGDAGGTVKVLVNIEKDARYLVKAESALAEANIGDVLDLQGGTGAQNIDVDKSSPLGQLIVLKLGDGIRGTDNTYAICSIAKNQRQS